MFNTYFTNVGNDLKSKIGKSKCDPLSYLPSFVGTPLGEFHDTDAREVMSIVDDMRNVGGGHDNINTKIFKSTHKSIISKIVHFINICFQQSVFPSLAENGSNQANL